jgi:hypothetical protein
MATKFDWDKVNSPDNPWEIYKREMRRAALNGRAPLIESLAMPKGCGSLGPPKGLKPPRSAKGLEAASPLSVAVCGNLLDHYLSTGDEAEATFAPMRKTPEQMRADERAAIDNIRLAIKRVSVVKGSGVEGHALRAGPPVATVPDLRGKNWEPVLKPGLPLTVETETRVEVPRQCTPSAGCNPSRPLQYRRK